MRTFVEFLNAQPQNLENSWRRVETTWEEFLRELHDHLRDNMGKYDAHHAKFGNLSNEHPDQKLHGIVSSIEKGFEKLKDSLSSLGAHEML